MVSIMVRKPYLSPCSSVCRCWKLSWWIVLVLIGGDNTCHIKDQFLRHWWFTTQTNEIKVNKILNSKYFQIPCIGIPIIYFLFKHNILLFKKINSFHIYNKIWQTLGSNVKESHSVLWPKALLIIINSSQAFGFHKEDNLQPPNPIRS